MLIKEVAAEFSGKVEVVDEDFGVSPLAQKFGIEEYPAVFVGDALVARPQDFHEWETSVGGRYVPWKEAANRERFQQDLRHFIRVSLNGGVVDGFQPDQVAGSGSVRSLPGLELRTLQGTPLKSSDLAGKTVLVEFWATWCPPCLRSLDFLREFAARHAPQVVVLGLAVNSEEAAVRALIDRKKLNFPVVMAEEGLLAQFGSVLAIPTLMIFDSEGRRAQVFYGAPPDLHERIGRAVETLLRKH